MKKLIIRIAIETAVIAIGMLAVLWLYNAFTEDSCHGAVVIYGPNRPTLCLTDEDIRIIKEMEWPKKWERSIDD